MPLAATLAALALAGLVVARGATRAEPAVPPTVVATSPAYPLRVSASERYLVDSNDTPFLMVGDSPQALIGVLNDQDIESFLANRQRYGFNTVWVNLLCNDYTGCKADGTTFDGTPPFVTPGDLGTPNEAYFARVDRALALAGKYGMNVLLDPIETGGWLKVLRANGTAKAYQYGVYVGTRYKDVPNIIWMSGNDFQSWSDPTDDALVVAVAQGIRAADPVHLQSVELNYYVSSSLDDPTWQPLIQLEAAYTYQPTYAEVLKDYARENFKPVVMVEANYEQEHDYTGPATLRRQEYWAVLSGAAGQLFGNKYTWQFAQDWKSHLDTSGSLQLAYATNLFSSRSWYDLVPDQQHSFVTQGFGTFASTGSVNNSDYVTAAVTSDHKLGMAYVPSARTLTVDMTQLAGPVNARWYDPTNGTYATISDAPLDNVGPRDFTTPGKNSAGDGDWVLVLELSS